MSLEATLTSADIITATEGSAVLDFFKQAGITDQTVTRIRSTLEGVSRGLILSDSVIISFRSGYIPLSYNSSGG